MFVKENPDTKKCAAACLKQVAALHHQFPRRKLNTSIKPDQYFVSQGKNIFVAFGDIVTIVISPHTHSVFIKEVSILMIMNCYVLLVGVYIFNRNRLSIFF